MKVLHELPFFDKIESCVLRGCNFTKMLFYHKVFFFQKNLKHLLENNRRNRAVHLVH